MLGVPLDLDLSPFVGAVLLQLCAGQNELIFRFDRDVSLTVEGDMLLRRDDAELRGRQSPFATAFAMGFLSGEIVAAHHDPSSITFDFEHGSIQLLDSERHYESFQIRIGDVTIPV